MGKPQNLVERIKNNYVYLWRVFQGKLLPNRLYSVGRTVQDKQKHS